VQKFEAALTSVCQTIKERDRLGQFGIGLICPIGKCTRFLFTSNAKGEKDFNQWTFESSLIIAQNSDVTVPHTVRKDLQFSHVPSKGVPWRTEMRIESFRSDLRIKRDFERVHLTREIQERFSHAMRKKGATIQAVIISETGEKISWGIKPQEYHGTPLSEHKERSRAGETVFRLFLSQRSGRKWKGKGVLVGELGNDFRIDFRTFSQSNASAFFSEETIRAFQTGIFEGEILCSGITLRPDRVSFEQNSRLEAFCAQINAWIVSVGTGYIEEARSQTQAERYQQAGIASLRVLKMVFEKYPFLADIMDNFKWGTVGEHHSDVGVQATETQKKKSLSVHSAGSPRTESENEAPPLPPYKSADKEEHFPLTAQGPKGRRRTLVKDDSLGLQFSYEGLEDSNHLFELDTKRGILTFNVRHPLWTQAEDGGDRGLMQFQEMVAILALCLEAYPDQLRPHIEDFTIKEYFPPIVFLQVFGDKERGTQTIWKKPSATPVSRSRKKVS